MVKRATSLFNLFCSTGCCKTNCAFFCCPFLRIFTVCKLLTVKLLGNWIKLSQDDELQRAIYFYFTVLPGDIRPIERDGITITFNYRPVFSNVLDIAITARNSNPVTLHQVVMGLDVPTVSLQSFLHILKCHIYNNWVIFRALIGR